ncbi:Hsp70 family protein [Chitinilyticum piscinae]|uniref:Hsp70 family protein n=1 Tax=Chitinilyticum piscinae TaxID=2866724 RepID=A0A8J7FPM2_9NEIS|nr:Hsp70 family protein [Chitinilyticum piscinae]MBE9608271.1 Hsp70 family protein [Chitinilyticum piscinae]
MTRPLLPACGIDFGTSNSTAAIHDGQRARLLALEDGKVTLPSAIFFNVDEDSHSYGRAALAEYLDGYEGRLMRSMKSLLGSSLMDAGTEVAGRHLRFRDLLGQFIGEVKRRAEAQAQTGFTQVVLGRPVRFVDDDDAADALAERTLGEIARDCGFREISFQYEPLAAAHDYEQDITREELVLVIDIGGGTSDFSLVRLSPERRGKSDRSSDLLAHGGVHIGGTDFDRQLSLAAVMPELGLGLALKDGKPFPSSVFFQLATWHTIHLAYTRKTWSDLQNMARDVADRPRYDRLARVVRQQRAHEIAIAIEAAKIALSANTSTRIELDALEDGFCIDIPREILEDAIGGDIQRVVQAALATLASAGVRPEQLDTLFFTGGASAVPALRLALAGAFPAAQAVEGDAYGSVGSGLAVTAQQRYG